MPEETETWGQPQALQWTPHLIKRLRGKRSQAEFGALLGAPKNTVWRWEAGQAHPDARYAARLSELAEREHFLTDWQLASDFCISW
jgi:DNA-binding transcriptional regulator YiaG